MSAILNLFRTGAGSPSWNMAFDEALLEQCALIGSPILRLYSWSQPAATFGYSQHFSDIAAWTALRPLIRRPTGGGLVPHDSDWTYSLVFPPSDRWYRLRAEESYRRTHDWISASFRALEIPAELSDCCDKPVMGRCFIGAEKFDVLAAGKKIAGAAQKRNQCGLLVQGSIRPPASFTTVQDRTTWEKILIETACRDLAAEWTELKPSEDLLSRAVELDREKYSTDAYNRRR